MNIINPHETRMNPLLEVITKNLVKDIPRHPRQLIVPENELHNLGGSLHVFLYQGNSDRRHEFWHV